MMFAAQKNGGEKTMQFIELLNSFLQVFTPLFVMLLIFNIGFNQDPKMVGKVVMENKSYFAKLSLYNNVIIPLAVFGILQFLPLAQHHKDGLVVLFVCTGAPLAVALVKITGHRVTYATASILTLIAVTIIVSPILLPILIKGTNINVFNLVTGLIKEVAIPLILGLILQQFRHKLPENTGAFLEKLESISLNIFLVGMAIVHFPNIIGIVGEGAIVTGILLLFGAFFGGYLMDKGEERERQLATAFASGQKDVAIAVSVAMNNFPEAQLMLLTIIVVTTIGTISFVTLAKQIGKRETVASY